MMDNNTADLERDEIRKILIVDDEKDFVMSLTDILESYGYTVETAHNVKEATEKIREFKAHVALLDIRLGNESGINLILRLKETVPNLLSVMMTAYAAADTAIEALQEGAYDYLRKPMSPNDLLATLDRCFEKLRLEKEKTASEERYRLLVETMNEGLGMQDQNGILTYVNDKLCEMTGFSRGELIGSPITNFIDENNIKLYEQYAVKLLSGDCKSYELELLRKGGETFSALISPQVVYDSDGHLKGLFSIITDISERKEAEEKRLEMESQLQQAQKMESIGTLAGGISHDFNNSLQAILGYAQMLLMATEKTDPKYSRLLQIEKAAERASELIEQLLAFSRKVESRLRPVDLNQEVKQLEKLLQRTIPKMIDIELNLEKNLSIISADPAQVEQIMMNLAVNARDAMGEEGTLKIETENVKLEKEYCKNYLDTIPGNYVLLKFSDTGQGMDEETVEKIYEPFFTTKEVGKGTGLGLSMVYGLVKKHKGHITCQSKPGEGTCFKVYFPVELDNTREMSDEIETDLPPKGDETILLIDDEAMVRDLGEQILSEFGYKVLTEIDGEGGIKTYQGNKESISLIILDLMMPGMGGRRCLEEILRINPDMKVVITSGYTSDGNINRAMEKGARGFIKKPFDMRQMLVMVRNVLDA